MSRETSKTDNYRWNFAMGLVHGVAFTFGMAFSEPFAVLPIFMSIFTKSKLLIGLMISIIKSGSSIPQLLVARKLQRMKRGKPILIAALWIRWLAWGFLAGVTFLWGAQNPLIVVIAFVFFLTMFSIGGGIAAIPFYNMVSQAIPPNKRGKFWGMRQFWGGLLAVLAGYLVKLILANEKIVFPHNYGVLFFITFALLAVSYAGLSLFKEQEATKTVNKKSKHSMWKHLRSYPPLRRAILTNILSHGTFFPLPFFVLYAKENLAIPTSWIGYFISAQMGGAIFSNLIWSRLSDRFGAVTVIKGSTIFGLLAVIVALTAKTFVLYLFVFVFMGFYLDGAVIGFSNYILEIGSSEVRPLFLSIHGTFKFPIYFFPLIGGFIVGRFGYTVLFIVSSIIIAGGLFLSFFLCEPRHGEAMCELDNELFNV